MCTNSTKCPIRVVVVVGRGVVVVVVVVDDVVVVTSVCVNKATRRNLLLVYLCFRLIFYQEEVASSKHLLNHQLDLSRANLKQHDKTLCQLCSAKIIIIFKTVHLSYQKHHGARNVIKTFN